MPNKWEEVHKDLKDRLPILEANIKLFRDRSLSYKLESERLLIEVLKQEKLVNQLKALINYTDET